MMKRSLLTLASALLMLVASAQLATTGFVSEAISAKRSAGVQFNTVQLFSGVPKSSQSDALWDRALTNAKVLRMDRAATSSLLAARPTFIAMELPTEAGSITIDLERVEITMDDFSVVTASTGGAIPYAPGVHYQGAVRGVPGSTAAISVFENEVMGIVSDASGERVLGRFENDTEGNHVFYREADLRAISGAVCGTLDEGDIHEERIPQGQGGAKTVKCVRLYWEVNYDIFQGKGSVANATNYVTGLFNQSSILYNNDGISVALSQVYVWDVPSPYTQTSTSALLDQFGVTRTSFNGDLGHLLGYAGGGGIAWLNTLCSSQTRYRMAYSDINSTYQNVPTFSWSVEVVTHEQGHNMGSKHTHACAWNGNNTAIDGCGPAAGYTEGSCAQAAVPPSSVGGTIMSYCHLVSAGINFANGFGPQPRDLIVSRINSASCLTACGAQTCNVPTNLAAGSITTTSTNLSWTGVSGATSYTLQWKLNSSSTWTTVTGITGTSYSLTGLAANTAYNFRVLTVCAGGSSAYASQVNFTTSPTATCNVPGSLNATGITNNSANLSWGAVSGAVSYTLQWKLNSSSAWTTVTGITGTSYSLTGLAASTAYNFRVLTVCSGGSSAYASQFNFTTSAPATCNAPGGLSAGSITSSSALLSWGAVTGVVSYTLQWKLNSSSTWTTVTGITGTSYTLTGLAASTAYNFRVLTVCSSGSSAYASQVNFTTGAVSSCTDPYGSNNSQWTATSVSGNTTLTATIGSSSDLDWYRFSNTSSARNIKVTLTGLPANYDIRLYRMFSQVGSSSNGGTANEQIILNTSTVSSYYYVRVAGSGGAFNANQCYTLTIQTSGTPFSMPEGMPEEPVIEEELSEGIVLFPNPASDEVNITVPASDQTTQVELLDGTGRVVGTFTHGSAETAINMVLYVGEQTNGLYFVRVTQGGESFVERLVISR